MADVHKTLNEMLDLRVLPVGRYTTGCDVALFSVDFGEDHAICFLYRPNIDRRGLGWPDDAHYAWRFVVAGTPFEVVRHEQQMGDDLPLMVIRFAEPGDDHDVGGADVVWPEHGEELRLVHFELTEAEFANTFHRME